MKPGRGMYCGLMERAIFYKGLNRTALVYVPRSVCDAQVAAQLLYSAVIPLVVNIHCYGCTAQNAIEGMKDQAEKYGFAILAPRGVNNSWNARDCCGDALRANLDDVGFIAALVHSLLSQRLYSSGPELVSSAVYLSGFSNGGFMSSLMGLLVAQGVMDPWFQAIAAQAGQQSDPGLYAAGRIPVPVLFYHSEIDLHVKWSGCCESAFCCCEIRKNEPVCVPMQIIFEGWSRINRCQSLSVVPLTHLFVPLPLINTSAPSLAPSSPPSPPRTWWFSSSPTPLSSTLPLSRFWYSDFEHSVLDDDDGVDDDKTEENTNNLQKELQCVRGENCSVFTALCKFRGDHGSLSGPLRDEDALSKFFMMHACKTHRGTWNVLTAHCTCTHAYPHPYNPYCLSPPLTHAPSSLVAASDSSSSPTSAVTQSPSTLTPTSQPTVPLPAELPWLSLITIIIVALVSIAVLARCCKKHRRRPHRYEAVAPSQELGEAAVQSSFDDDPTLETDELLK